MQEGEQLCGREQAAVLHNTKGAVSRLLGAQTYLMLPVWPKSHCKNGQEHGELAVSEQGPGGKTGMID